MNKDEARRLLAFRAQTTRVGYVEETVDMWTEALTSVTEHDARQAVKALIADGRTDITVPAIRQWLREQQAIERRAAELSKPSGGPIQFACMDPAAVQARRDWWQAGRQGHWPGCPCDSCTTRRTWNGDAT